MLRLIHGGKVEDDGGDEPEKPYRMRYNLRAETGKWTQAECEEFGGGTDALIVHSLLYPEDGSFSMVTTSVDGRTDTDLKDIEMFKVWLMMASRLAESETLDKSKRDFAETVFATYRAAILDARED